MSNSNRCIWTGYSTHSGKMINLSCLSTYPISHYCYSLYTYLYHIYYYSSWISTCCCLSYLWILSCACYYSWRYCYYFMTFSGNCSVQGWSLSILSWILLCYGKLLSVAGVLNLTLCSEMIRCSLCSWVMLRVTGMVLAYFYWCFRLYSFTQ